MAELLHSPLTLVIAQAVIIILASRLLGVVGRLIGQPLVIAEVVAGIVLGPSLLGWLSPDVVDTFFPKSSMPLLGILSQVGLIFLMFLVGLELDPTLLRGRGRQSLIISHSSIVVPFGLGAALAVYLYPRVSNPAVSYTAFWLFMGIAMSITAFPVLARILTERRLVRSRVGALAIACAAVDDVTAWCLLAFVVSAARSTGLPGAVLTTVLALAYITVMLLLVRPFLRRMVPKAESGLTQNLVAVTFVLLLTSAFATEAIGIHALFGAFMLGVILPREGGLARALAEKLEDFVVVFLLPLFFAFSGLRTEIGLLNTSEAWVMCLIVIFVACLGKFGGSFVAARLTGLTWRESGAIGILMNTRGLMELVVLNIGLDLGVISPLLFTMMVLMALVTTFMTSPILHLVYPPEALARELAETTEPQVAPAVRPAFTVLVCVAYEHTVRGLMTLLDALVGDQKEDSSAYVLRLQPPPERVSAYVPQHVPHDGERAEQALAPLLERSAAAGLRARPITFVSANPARDICSVADVKETDIILLGWRQPILGGAALSGTVFNVMRQSRRRVGVLVDRGLVTVSRVLVPYLGNPHDHAAMELANRLHEHTTARVTILHVVSPGRSRSEPRLNVSGEVEQVFHEPASADGRVDIKVVESTEPTEAALQEMRSGYDLVIIGAGKEWGLAERPFAVQPEYLVDHSPVSLLVVRGAAAGP